MKLKLNESVALANAKGIKILKKDLAAKLFIGSDPHSQRVLFSRLASGRTKRISVEHIETICDICQVTPNFLFGYE